MGLIKEKLTHLKKEQEGINTLEQLEGYKKYIEQGQHLMVTFDEDENYYYVFDNLEDYECFVVNVLLVTDEGYKVFLIKEMELLKHLKVRG